MVDYRLNARDFVQCVALITFLFNLQLFSVQAYGSYRWSE